MATHSSILSWRIPWTVQPGGLQSVVTESDMPGLNPRVPEASLGVLAGRGGPSLCNGS